MKKLFKCFLIEICCAKKSAHTEIKNTESGSFFDQLRQVKCFHDALQLNLDLDKQINFRNKDFFPHLMNIFADYYNYNVTRVQFLCFDRSKSGCFSRTLFIHFV